MRAVTPPSCDRFQPKPNGIFAPLQISRIFVSTNAMKLPLGRAGMFGKIMSSPCVRRWIVPAFTASLLSPATFLSLSNAAAPDCA